MGGSVLHLGELLDDGQEMFYQLSSYIGKQKLAKSLDITYLVRKSGVIKIEKGSDVTSRHANIFQNCQY